MDQAQFNWLTNFIWNISDDVLRDLHVRGRYRDIILPMTVLRRFESRIGNEAAARGFWRLYTDDFYDIRLPVPPTSEQTEIMAGVSKQTADLKTAIARTEREIALMQEYPTRLTADVVTSNLDLRSAAANLSAEEDGIEKVLDSAIKDVEDSAVELETARP